MARPLRIEYPGAVYHITARGNEKKPIFIEKKDYIKLLSILDEAKQRYTLKIYSYVLMPNHYHLLLETPKANLIQAMHYIQSKYTIYFNRQHNRVGHLFQGRYKSLLVDKDNYLIELVRYIHLNPVRARIVHTPAQYKWSSYREYFNQQGIVDTQTVLEYFGNDQKKFKEFTFEGITKKWEDIADSVYGQVIIGTKQFTDKIKRMVEKNLGAPIDKEISFSQKMKKRIAKEELINLIVKYFRTTKEKLFNKKDRWNEPRKICIYLIRKYTDTPLKLIGQLFGGIHYTAVSHIAKKIELRRSEDKTIDKMLVEIESKIKT